MSLIQEALKRKAEEKGETVFSPGGTTGIHSSQPKAKGPNIPLIILTVLLAAGLFAGLIGLASYLMPPDDNKLVAEPPRIMPTESLPPEPAQPLPAIESPPKEPAVSAAAGEPELPVQIEWPELNLSGIASGENQRIAIINGKMLSSGRTVSGVTVLDVGESDVIVEYMGEQRILHVDE
jgi:hypothetical protein